MAQTKEECKAELQKQVKAAENLKNHKALARKAMYGIGVLAVAGVISAGGMLVSTSSAKEAYQAMADGGVVNYEFLDYEDTFDKWNKAISIEYEPLENYRRTEHWDDTGSNSGTSETTGTNQNDYLVTTYENDTLHQRDRTSDSGTSNTEASGEYSNERDGLAYGNIRVTTSQQMLESELEVARWNLIEQITDMFIRDFCILVYV